MTASTEKKVFYFLPSSQFKIVSLSLPENSFKTETGLLCYRKGAYLPSGRWSSSEEGAKELLKARLENQILSHERDFSLLREGVEKLSRNEIEIVPMNVGDLNEMSKRGKNSIKSYFGIEDPVKVIKKKAKNVAEVVDENSDKNSDEKPEEIELISQLDEDEDTQSDEETEKVDDSEDF